MCIYIYIHKTETCHSEMYALYNNKRRIFKFRGLNSNCWQVGTAAHNMQIMTWLTAQVFMT